MLIKSKQKTAEENIEDIYITFKNRISLPKINETTFIIQYNGENKGQLYIEILDLLGNKVLSENINENNSSITLNSFKRGMYLCRIYNGNSLVTVKQLISM